MARGNIARLEELMETVNMQRLVFGVQENAVRLDALATLRDRERIDEETPRFLPRDTYPEPFALRALGVVRDDRAPSTRRSSASGRSSSIGTRLRPKR